MRAGRGHQDDVLAEGNAAHPVDDQDVAQRPALAGHGHDAFDLGLGHAREVLQLQVAERRTVGVAADLAAELHDGAAAGGVVSRAEVGLPEGQGGGLDAYRVHGFSLR